MIKKKKYSVNRSIRGNIRLSLLSYTAVTIVMLWLFQIVFLNTYYKIMQKNTIVSAGTDIANNLETEGFPNYLASVCYRTNTSAIVMLDDGTQISASDMQGKKSIIKNMRPRELLSMFKDVFNGEETELFFEPQGKENFIYCREAFSTKQVRYIIIIDAQLEPVDSTTKILKSQLGLISLILVVTALVISTWLSNKLAEPIKGISHKAKRLAKGDYTADYDGKGLEETDELAETLNYSAKELSKVEDLRRELVANVSHDLKTPLTMIRGYAEMIRDLTGENKEKRNEQLDVIIDETNRLTTLVNDVIRVSRDEISQQKMKPENINLNKMIKAITEKFIGAHKDYKIEIDLCEEEKIFADITATNQVLYNLISNAINYTGDDKVVKIKTEKSNFGVKVLISDTGKGIPKEQLKLIWERYYRSNNTHARPVAGSGLGLSIVKEALEKQKFPFGVESKEGKGSTFWFEAPIGNG